MSTTILPQTAFLGLGAMGHGMATNLISKSYPLTGYDISSFSLNRFTTSAAPFTTSTNLTATTPLSAVKGARVIILMVATAAQIHEALFTGKEAAIHGIERDASVLLCTTGPLGYAEEIEKVLREEWKREDIKLVDCPVSGGAKRARDGTLTILASGKEEALADKEVRGVLDACAGGNLWIIEGGLGQGTKVKMVHQVLAGIHITMTAEVVGFLGRLMEEEGEGEGGKLDLKSAYEYLKESDGNSWMFENRVGHLLEKEGEGKGTVYSALNIIVKDVAIITTASRTLQFPVFLTAASEQVLFTGVTSGMGLIDDSLLFQVYLPNQPKLTETLTNPSSTTSASSQTATNSSSSHPHLPLLRNILRAVHLVATSEALCLGARVGLDPHQLYDIIIGAAGNSAVFTSRGKEIITGRWKGSKTVSETIEELKSALTVSHRLRHPLHLTSTALQIYELAALKGWADEKDVVVTRIWDSGNGKDGNSWFPSPNLRGQGNY